MKTQHTPGPWHVFNQREVCASNDGTIMIARIQFATDDNGKANARLIASAPELLEALIAIVASEDTTLGDGGSILGDDLRYLARSAIRQAIGEGWENAGCDECGTYDRMPGSNLCSGCATGTEQGKE